jgi:hypothetical protein
MSDDLDPGLKALYARIPKDEPSLHVDAAILSAAARPVSAPRHRDWLLSFGAVASVVLVSTWAVYLQVREPDALRQAVSVSPPPAPVAAPPEMKVEAKDEIAREQVQAARRSEELARLRAELAGRETAGGGATTSPADLPTVRLRPEAPVTASRQAAAGAEPTMDLLGEPPVAAAPPAATALPAKPKAMALERTAIASVLMEGVSLGMTRDDLAALGWGCAQPVCVRQIDDPRQPAYWGLPTQGATQRALFLGGTVTALSLSQVNVALNNVKLALERIGKPSERTCPLGGGEQLVGRQAGNMILSLWQDGEVTILGACLAKE